MPTTAELHCIVLCSVGLSLTKEALFLPLQAADYNRHGDHALPPLLPPPVSRQERVAGKICAV
jgi:hypothetical protein